MQQRAVHRTPKARFCRLLFLLLLISSTAGRPADLETQTGPSVPSEAADGGSDSLSPDDTLFAHLRCIEQFASKHSREREQDVAEWLGADERYLRWTERTPRFLLCVLVHLRLYDMTSAEFNTRILMEQNKKYNRWMTLSEEAVQLFANETESLVLANATSAGVYDAFEPLFRNHSSAYFQLFLREPTVLQQLYNEKEFLVRKPNQTVIDYCELQMGEELWDDICRIRSYEISNQTVAMEAHITCIFRGFHYLTQEGYINEFAIVQDFSKAAVLNEATALHIGDCARESSQEETIGKRSLRMYGCLLDGASSDQFKEAFDFREIRSGNLTYLLKNLPYERNQVKQQILALDKERCDDQQRPNGRIIRFR